MDTSTLDKQLNDMILAGQALDAFEKFYSDDCVMIEGSGQRFEGKDVNRKREQDFFASVEEVHAFEIVGSTASEDRSYSEWVMDVTLKGMGRIKMEQVSARVWRDGQVAQERFYYNAS